MNTHETIKNMLRNFLTEEMSIRDPDLFRCINPNHEDRNPSMSLYKARDGFEYAKCFSCNVHYDTFDAVAIHYFNNTDIEFGIKYNKACEHFRIEIKQGDRERAKQDRENSKTLDRVPLEEDKQKIREMIVEAHKHVNKTDYFKKRGLTDETITRFKLGYYSHLNVAIIPIGEEYYIGRNIDPTAPNRYKNLPGLTPPLLNEHYMESCTNGDIIVITEGALDAISIEQAGEGLKAIALNSVSNERRLIELAKEKNPKATLVISLDNDEAGTKATKTLLDALEGLNLDVIALNLSLSFKDQNEALQRQPDAFKSQAQNVSTLIQQERDKERQAQLEQYQKQSSAGRIGQFIQDIKNSINRTATPTGFKRLDEVLDGGLYDGLYILGAISSLGKTTILLQVADQIAQQGEDVIIFSLEMSRSEIIAKSVSRETYLLAKDKGQAKTARGILDGRRYEKYYSETEIDLIAAALDRYTTYGKHVYIHEGSGDIGAFQVRDIVQQHIAITGKKPTVIVDYLQILAPYDPRYSDKQNTDKAVLELKRISRDLRVPVIAVSSFNRMNYNTPVSMEAFKESGAIEYSADVLIGLQLENVGKERFDVNQAKNKDPREIELVILKNRNGSTGQTIAYKYKPKFNLFLES